MIIDIVVNTVTNTGTDTVTNIGTNMVTKAVTSTFTHTFTHGYSPTLTWSLGVNHTITNKAKTLPSLFFSVPSIVEHF